MSKITWEWLAGFTDGEGNFAIVGRGPRVTWGQNDKYLMDCLDKFLRSEGFHPNYYSVAPNPPKRPNRIYLMNLCRRTEVIRIMNCLEPLMILKIPQCRKVKEWLNQHPRIHNCDPVNDDDRKQIRLWIEEGYSARWIAEKSNRDRQKIYKLAKQWGFTFHPSGGRSLDGRRLPNVRW